MQLNIDFIFAAFNCFYNYKNNETINHIKLLVIKHLNAKKANNKKVISKLLITLNEYCSIIIKTDINISTFNNDIISIILRFNRVQIYQYMKKRVIKKQFNKIAKKSIKDNSYLFNKYGVSNLFNQE